MIPFSSQAQQSFFEPADSFQRSRFTGLSITGATMYAGLMIGLNEAWYDDIPKSSFHFFNDWSEWKNMDKYGHWYSAYNQSRLAFGAARWCGISDEKAIWTAAALGFFVQGSIELFDGYSEKWGFSWYDIAFNLLGNATFVVQQKLWNEQRILSKISHSPIDYPETPLISTNGSDAYSLDQRAKDLFGLSFAETFLKDYNAQTIWASFSIKSFLSHSNWPRWLNLALGYSAENLYAGFDYNFKDPLGNHYNLNPQTYPRFGNYF